MSVIEVIGGTPLIGGIKIQGSKNAALPLMAAALLCDECVIIKNCPNICDVATISSLLRKLGCGVCYKDGTLSIDPAGTYHPVITDTDVGRSRASVLLLGALVGKCHHAVLACPGGCKIGARKIDLHLYAMQCLGMQTEEKEGLLLCMGDRPKGCDIFFPYPSVGATENAILASVLAEGVTTVHNAAKEPEIDALCTFLNRAGAKISRKQEDVSDGTEQVIVIEGAERLSGGTYRLPGDRIVAGTYLIAAAGSRGHIRLSDVPVCELHSPLTVLEEMGCEIFKNEAESWVELRAGADLQGAMLTTAPYPAFPTDLQSQMTALFCVVHGESKMVETVFENRFHAATMLVDMGAQIQIGKNGLKVQGTRLHGCSVQAGDLRGGAALVLAGIFAKGKTVVHDPQEYIKRGYEDIVRDLRRLGAGISQFRG